MKGISLTQSDKESRIQGNVTQIYVTTVLSTESKQDHLIFLFCDIFISIMTIMIHRIVVGHLRISCIVFNVPNLFRQTFNLKLLKLKILDKALFISRRAFVIRSGGIRTHGILTTSRSSAFEFIYI